MRRMIAFALVALSFFSYAAFPDASFFVEPDENVSLQVLDTGAGSYAVVSIGGSAEMVLDAQNKPLMGVAELRRVLEEYFFEQVKWDERTSRIGGTVQVYASQGSPAQEQCFQLTGMSAHQCIDRESCLEACLSVPVCASAAGTEDFLFAMLDYNDSAAGLDSQIAGFGDELGRARQEGAPGFQLVFERLNAIKTLSSEISKNRLIGRCPGCFDYCRKPSFDYSLLHNASAEIGGLALDYEKKGEYDARADDIANKTQERLAYVNTKIARYANLSSRISLLAAEVGTEMENVSQWVSDPEAVAQKSEIDRMAANLSSLAAGGYYRQAFALGDRLIEAADALNVKLLSRQVQYEELRFFYEKAGLAISDADKNLPSNSTARVRLAALKMEYARLKAGLYPPIRASEIEKLSGEAAALKNEAELLAARAMQAGSIAEKPESKAGACTLPISVIALTLLFAIAVREKT